MGYINLLMNQIIILFYVGVIVLYGKQKKHSVGTNTTQIVLLVAQQFNQTVILVYLIVLMDQCGTQDQILALVHLV